MNLYQSIKTWEPSADLLAQIGHFFIAATVVFGVNACLGIPPHWGLPLVLSYVIGKDWFFDLYYERDTWQGSAWDSLWYAIGSAAALGIYFATMGLR